MIKLKGKREWNTATRWISCQLEREYEWRCNSIEFWQHVWRRQTLEEELYGIVLLMSEVTQPLKC